MLEDSLELGEIGFVVESGETHLILGAKVSLPSLQTGGAMSGDLSRIVILMIADLI